MRKQTEALLATTWGTFNMVTYTKLARDKRPHVAMIHPEMDPTQPVHVSIHTACLMGDVFRALGCDCSERLDAAMSIIAAEKGIVIYLRPGDHKSAWNDKLPACKQQGQTPSTLERDRHIDAQTTVYNYQLAINILQHIGLHQIYLLTSAPLAIKAVQQSPIELVSLAPIIIPAKEENEDLLSAEALSSPTVNKLY